MNRLCPRCGKSAYNFPECPWCGATYSGEDKGQGGGQVEGAEENKSHVGLWFVLVTLLILLFGPFALGFLGAALKYLNDYFGFSPISTGGLISALHWAPILVYVTWPAAGLVVVAGLVLALMKGRSRP